MRFHANYGNSENMMPLVKLWPFYLKPNGLRHENIVERKFDIKY